MQCPQEHLKTIVYAKFVGANKVYYGEFENLPYLVDTSYMIPYDVPIYIYTEQKHLIAFLIDGTIT